MITYLNEDIDFGLNKEDTFFNLLLNKYTSVLKLPKKHKYDFYIKQSNKPPFFIELKTRRVNIDTFPTTYIGVNKSPPHEKVDVLFVFGFKDEDFYFLDYRENMKYLHDNTKYITRYNGEHKHVFDIEIEKLTKFL